NRICLRGVSIIEYYFIVFRDHCKGKRTLAVVSEHYEVVLDNAHTSQADSIAAVQVCQAIVTRFPDHFNVPLEQLFTQQIQWKADQAASFEQYLRRRNPEAF